MGYQKGYSPQLSLISMFKKWKKSLDTGEKYGALFVDSSKAFDCLLLLLYCRSILLAIS